MNPQKLIALVNSMKSYRSLRCASAELNDTESLICVYIYKHKNTTQDEIACAYGMDKTTVAKALKKLELNGFIVRTVNLCNRRKNNIAISEKGASAAKKIICVQKEWTEKVCCGISCEDLSVFFKVAERLLCNSIDLIKGCKCGCNDTNGGRKNG